MTRITVPLLKFVGTVSLGLLTGLSHTTTLITTPTLLTLPSASSANSTLTYLKQSTQLHSTALLALSIASYTLAYALSPAKSGRHPYLLWTSLLAGVSWGAGVGLERYFASEDAAAAGGRSTNGHGNGNGKPGVGVSLKEEVEDDYVDATHSSANILTPTSGQSEDGDNSPAATGKGGAGAVNGEQVRVAIERFGMIEGVKRYIAGAAFFMGVVGIWGDGVGVVARA